MNWKSTILTETINLMVAKKGMLTSYPLMGTVSVLNQLATLNCLNILAGITKSSLLTSRIA